MDIHLGMPVIPQSLSPLNARAQTVAALTQGPLHVLIVGGGIVGAGIARDAAMRGLRVGLLDQYDFAFGTSSRSTRLLHGGLRYLAQGRVGLVREASLEKGVLHRIAPHLAQPLPFIFPTYKGSGWPRWQMRIGVKLYDLLCSGRNLGRSSALSQAQVLDKVPKLKQDSLTGAVRYFDGLTNDARLVLDTLRSAARHGAMLMNYCGFDGGARRDGSWVCQAKDRLSGTGMELRAQAVVNAAGPWAADLPHSTIKLRLTKGIHLVIARERLPIPEAVAITQGHRLLFVIPWGERVILGTTDTDYHGSLDKVHADPEDIAYVLHSVNEYFPSVTLSEADVISTWAGLRPLLAHPDGSPSDISRAHEIRNPEPGWWDVAGGKLTIYRLMAEQTGDQIVKWLKHSGGMKQLHRDGQRSDRSRTADEMLIEAAEAEGVSGILPPPFGRAAVEHYCSKEWALHVEDVMVRRTSWHYYHADAGQKAERVAEWMEEMLGWSAEHRAAELDAYRALAR
jgi:glycerol-3-phosphate dehydrogenase